MISEGAPNQDELILTIIVTVRFAKRVSSVSVVERLLIGRTVIDVTVSASVLRIFKI